ncbi:MAG: YihA family ribosome biogenesis GTP-binding protein [Bacteroidales bacterium]|nr:YihA family ribosome biogenesis GTP-binding protein [Bacteroidales bacterium]MBN2764332.1 YihA family ribosome biogenesis GTP-binding protein [Bacteroidales bacterium]
MEITSVEFIKSSLDARLCPKPLYPEYAFAGRSNVGKSSLINMLTGSRHLAKTSSAPGKTRYINHYLVNREWYLVDLPGYGYAKASKKIKGKFPALIENYLLKRETLACLFILIDCRHNPLKNDMEFIIWAGQNHIPLILCFTKADKLSSSQLDRQLSLYRDNLRDFWAELPVFVVTSSAKNKGRHELLEIIDRSNQLMK